jgi:hypothetical protein
MEMGGLDLKYWARRTGQNKLQLEEEHVFRQVLPSCSHQGGPFD